MSKQKICLNSQYNMSHKQLNTQFFLYKKKKKKMEEKMKKMKEEKVNDGKNEEEKIKWR